jgi:adenosylmethionine-8-amino-7-oxononanoate aminotransferase
MRFVDKGIWVRPFGKLVYVMPPYIINDEELNSLLTAMTEAVAEELCI